MSAADRQALLAFFLDDPAFEARVRDEPERVAAERGVPLTWVRELAAIEPRRVRSFRISRRVKSGRREG